VVLEMIGLFFAVLGEVLEVPVMSALVGALVVV